MLTEENQNDASKIQFGFLVKKNIKDVEIFIPNIESFSLSEEDMILLKKNESNEWMLFIIPVNKHILKNKVRNILEVNLILHELKKHNIFIKDLKIDKRVQNSKFFNQIKYKFLKMKSWTK